MHTIEIPYVNKRAYLPEHLGECNTEQFIDVCGLLFNYLSGEVDYEELRVQMMYELLDIEQSNNALPEEAVANMYGISNLMDGAFIKSDKGIMPRLEFNTNPIPEITPKMVLHKGPKHLFMDTTFGQYQDALNIFHEYLEVKDPYLLKLLFATYYHPSSRAYDEKRVEEWARAARYIPPGALYGFFLYFSSFQAYLASGAVRWEGKVIDLSILFKNDNSSSSYVSPIPGLGMKSVAFQLAESGVFGTLKELRETNVWEILLRLYDIRKRDIDYKAEEALNKKSNE